MKFEKTPESSPGSNSTNLNDIFVVNLTLCGDVQVKREVERVPDPPQTLNIQRVRKLKIQTHMLNSFDLKIYSIELIDAFVYFMFFF